MISFWIPLAAASSAAGGLAIRRIRERWRVRRRMREVPEASAHVAESTEVRITGVVRGLDELLTSPLSARTCVLYRVRALGGGALSFVMRKGTPSTFGESFALRRFAIDRSEGGTVELDGEHVELDLPPTPRRSHASDRRESMRLVLGIGRKGSSRFEEVVLEPGARVVVTGFAMLELAAAPPSGELGFRDGAPPSLRLTGSRARPMTISRA